MGWTTEVRFPIGAPCPDRLWGLPNLLSNRYWELIPWMWPGREADHSPPTCDNVKNARSNTSTLAIHRKLGWACGIALGCGVDDGGFDSRQGLGIILLTTASGPALGSTQPPVQWVPGDLSYGVKRPGREPDHWPPSCAKVKNARNFISTLSIRLHVVVLS
jgi:hypothetical protein